MELALALFSLFNTVAPGVAQVILMVRKKDGTIAIMPLLDEAASGFEANIKQAADWLKTHPT